MRPVINYVEVPATQQEDINSGKSAWRNGKLVMLDEGRHVTVYLGHKSESRHEEDGTEKEVTVAFPVRIEKPATKAGAINSAEMEAYGLSDPMGVASMNASLARKWRLNINDLDVKGHDDFIAWVKRELDASGLFTKSGNGVDDGSPTLDDIIGMSKMMAVKDTTLTDDEALVLKRLYPQWIEYIGKSLSQGMKVQYGDKLYKVRQDIATVLENQPPSIDTAALYEEINETHAGTLEDPIPYNNNMELEEGKYYSQDGMTYMCTRSTGQAVYNNLSELVGIYVQTVESESFEL